MKYYRIGILQGMENKKNFYVFPSPRGSEYVLRICLVSKNTVFNDVINKNYLLQEIDIKIDFIHLFARYFFILQGHKYWIYIDCMPIKDKTILEYEQRIKNGIRELSLKSCKKKKKIKCCCTIK